MAVTTVKELTEERGTMMVKRKLDGAVDKFLAD